VYFEYICCKFAGRLLDRVNTLLLIPRQTDTDKPVDDVTRDAVSTDVVYSTSRAADRRTD